jgi:hypothetical protein
VTQSGHLQLGRPVIIRLTNYDENETWSIDLGSTGQHRTNSKSYESQNEAYLYCIESSGSARKQPLCTCNYIV